MRKHVLIAIEGVDGVGKTTVSQMVVSAIDAEYVKFPILKLFKKIAALAEKTGSRELEAAAYLMLAILSSIYLRLVLRKRNVVCDKYILVTIVDQIVLGSLVARWSAGFRYWLVPKPDFTFCLQVEDEAAIRARLGNRGKLDANDNQMFPFWREIQRLYRNFPEVIVVDTTTIGSHQTFSLLWTHLSKDERCHSS